MIDQNHYDGLSQHRRVREFIAATETAKDVIWLRGLLQELGFRPRGPSIIREDNQACVAMIRNHAVSGRNRHFCLKMSWLRQQVQNGIVEFRFVASKNNVADIFTKVLSDVPFLKLRTLLNLPQTHGCSNAGGVLK